jgi:hypothetical protein
VTERGLEDQLLALVVDHERPDLQEQASALVRQLAEYTITLKELEDNLLFRLANAQVGGWNGWLHVLRRQAWGLMPLNSACPM